jgi:NAD(P)-dependent dehydrogenase (short-subunit alcohol dehydrogenase family)
MSTVAVTGSASGIGAATRQRLVSDGHRVIGVDVVAGDGVDVVADLATRDGRRTAIDGVLAACQGRLDGLVTAAGVPPRFAAAEIVSINYFGTTELVRELRAALTSAGRSRVVVVSSVFASAIPGVPTDLVAALLAGDESGARSLVASYQPRQHMLVYAATKVAVARWVRRLAPTAEWARAGIRLNAIAPGATKTNFFAGLADDDERQDLIPVGFAAAPEQVASWIVMMLGEDAEFMCGSVVYVDGGSDAQRNADVWPDSPAAPAAPAAQPGGLRRLLRRG